MASPAEIKQNTPETLPADFGDWDSEESQAVGAVDSPKADSPKFDSADQGPRAVASRDSAATAFGPKELAAKSAPRELGPRSIENERNTAPIPRSPLGPPPNPRAYATPSGKGPRAVPPASSPYPEDDAFFRRIRSLNTVVDKLPVSPQPKEETAATAVATIAAAPAVEEEPRTEVEEEPSISFRTDLQDSEDEEERRARRKWMAIIAVGIGVVALVVFQLFRYGTLTQVRHIVSTPSTTTITSEPLPEASTQDETPAAQPLPAKPAAGASAQPEQQSQEDAPAEPASPAPVQSKMMHDQLLAPTRIPQGARAAASSDAPPAAGLSDASMAALGGNGPATGVFNGSGQSKTPAVMLKTVTVSAGVATGMLIHKTQPVYPSIAKAARVSGTVVIEATISKTGEVVNPHVVSGPQMLRQAALDAVKTWHYRPYKLNNEPTDVDTTIDMIFALSN